MIEQDYSHKDLDTNQPSTPSEPVNAPEAAWYLYEGVPGPGEKPEWLDSKYKNAAEQAKAYKEARKALGAMAGAPEEYNLDAYKEHLDLENQHLRDFLCYAKDNKFTQDALDKSIKTFLDYSNDYVEEPPAPFERADKETEDRVVNWAKANLPQSVQDALGKLPADKNLVTGLEEMRKKMTSQNNNLPIGNQEVNNQAPTEASLRQELRDNYKKYTENEIYRKDFEARLAKVVGQG